MLKKDFYELTSPQKNIWQMQQINEKNPSVCHILTIMQLRGNLNINLLEKSSNIIIKSI